MVGGDEPYFSVPTLFWTKLKLKGSSSRGGEATVSMVVVEGTFVVKPETKQCLAWSQVILHDLLW